MKLSIWQQFSSNHSANYTVVGVFDSVEKAQAITTQLKELVTKITAWYKTNLQTFGDGNWQPTPIEKELAESLGIEWNEPIDWVFLFGRAERNLNHRPPETFITRLDHCVFVNAPGSRTWQTGEQFISYLKSQGGTTYQDVYMGYPSNDEEPIFEGIEVTLRCKVPDTDTHKRLDELFRITSLGHIQQRFDDMDAPWIEYHPNNAEDDRRPEFTVESIKIDDDIILFDGLEAISLAHALPALVEWLRSLNCDVTYEFRQDDPDNI